MMSSLLQCRHIAARACKHGVFAYNNNDTMIGRSLDLYGEWCEPELQLLGRLIRLGAVVFDVGANLGTHTVFFSQRTGPGGLVLAGATSTLPEFHPILFVENDRLRK